MKTLVINCGSSSLKYQLIDMSTEASLVQGLVERIGINGSILTQKVEGKEKYIINSRYIYGKTQMELSEELGISQAQISRIEKNGLDAMEKVLK